MGFTICLVTEKMRELQGKLNVEMGFGFWCFCDEKFAFFFFLGVCQYLIPRFDYWES